MEEVLYINSQCALLSVGSANQLVNTLITSILALHCNITNPNVWPDDYGQEGSINGFPSYDFIVIGAGTAGSVVAGRLAENPEHQVLLLEAGGDPPLESEIPGLAGAMMQTKYDWNYRTESNGLSCLAMNSESCTWNRGKMVGGSGSMNSMNYLRGIPSDYDQWESRGNFQWSFLDVLPYFKKSEDFRGMDNRNVHGRGGPIPVEPFRASKYDQNILLEAARELNYNFVKDFTDDDIKGFGFLHGTVRDGRRVSTAKAFLTDKKTNLHLVKNAVADLIQFDRRNQLDAVSFVYGGNKFSVKAKKEVIVSAGSIETPKLLMLSGIGPVVHLHAMGIPVVSDLQVGSNLQDHAFAVVFMRVQYKNSPDPDVRMLDAIYEQWVHRSGFYGSVGSDIAGFTNTNKNSPDPDIMYMWRPVANITEAVKGFKDVVAQSILRQVGQNDRVFRVYIALMRPQSTGFIRLGSRNYKDDPLIIPNSFQKDIDSVTMVRGIKELMEFEKTDTMKSINGRFLRLDLPVCDSNRYRSAQYWQCYIQFMTGAGYHPVGTAKMGSIFDYSAVVDPQLRVRGVKGLRVIDASVFPTIITGHVNAPTTMIAEKGADLVKESWMNPETPI